MSWRTIVVSKRCKLDLKMGCMVIRSEETKRINLDEISAVIIENTAISITGCLINEIIKHKIKLVFCDEKYNPCCELVSLHGSHDSSAKVRQQTAWNSDIKAVVWTAIVSEKIKNQSHHLRQRGKNNAADLLNRYINEMELNDESNREGHAAKVYFNALFGQCFSRDSSDTINSALNYGYSIILSAVNREISASGYITQLGLFHNNMFNHFNLGCDLMEPFRVIVDRKVVNENYTVFETEQKHNLITILNETVVIDGRKQYLQNAIGIYCKSVFEALNERDASLIKFINYCDID